MKKDFAILAMSDDFTTTKNSHNRMMRDEDAAAMLRDIGYRPGKGHADPYKPRPFIAWDGEGITYPNQVAQDYVLFGASTGHMVKAKSLSTEQCFDILLQCESTNPDAIHVGFSLKYDFNMMIRDLPWRVRKRIYDTNRGYWQGYRIEYLPGKWIAIKKGSYFVRLFDVFGFFQSSFITACENFLGKSDPELQQIREGKAARQSFELSQLDDFIIPYWQAELRLLVRLMESLRKDLHNARLDIGSWHGPGAVANKVFHLNGIKTAKGSVPDEVSRYAQYGYAGGRFELYRCGNYPNSVFEYDINSAYPEGITQLPRLSTGTWEHVSTFDPDVFGIWHCGRFTKSATILVPPQPLFCRHKQGNISYPLNTEGWYWTPEAKLVPETVREGWVFHDDGSRPFEFVREMYIQRQQWKSEGNSAERALKLGLNSLYGKMAQRVGGREGRVPTWHQLEWAGYVTSYTRAKLYQAIMSNPTAIIAVETDAVFSTVPLDGLELGNDLGNWKRTEYDGILYFQNGMYYATKNGEVIERFRGFDKGSLPYRKVLDYLTFLDRYRQHFGEWYGVPSLFGDTTRFVGFGLAFNTKSVWCSWEKEKRQANIGGGGKRSHITALCPQCIDYVPISENLHSLTATTLGGTSFPHILPWRPETDDYEADRYGWDDKISLEKW